MIARLARLRVPLGFVCGALVLWLARPTQGSLLVGGVIGIAGEALRVWAAGHLYKSSEVTVSGPYRYLAHPLYVGSSLLGAGLAVASNSLAVVVLIAAYLGATLGAAIRSEEAFLRRAFGEQYDRYRGGRPGGRGEGAARRFSLERAIANREHRAAAGLLAAVLLLLWKASYNGTL